MRSSKLFAILTLLALLTLNSCGIQKKTTANTLSFDGIENSILVQNAQSAFALPDVPESVSNSRERAIYLSKHYWDLYPFSDSSLISQTNITEQGFVDYIHILNYIPFNHAKKSLMIFLDKAQEHPAMYSHFAGLFEKYYYDAESPYRNEELYIPVLNSLLKSRILSNIEQRKYDFQREMIHKNRVGTKAVDFTYTLSDGDSKRMRAIKSDFLILFFTNPDCGTRCEVIDDFNNSEMLEKVFSHNSFNRSMLTVLSVYPGDNVKQWMENLSSMPEKNWINAYDRNMVITNKRLYDIKTIPTIYLLDNKKRIILKDTSLEEIESFFVTKQ